MHTNRHMLKSGGRILVSFILVTLALGQGMLSPIAAQTDESSWTVSDTRDIQVDGDPIALSPDGQWIAGIGPDQAFCVWAVDDLAATCESAEIHPMAESIAWAPDSSAVAYSDNAGRYLVDSDIMVFDIASMTLMNMTDTPDEASEFSLGSDETTFMDVFPTWAADSQSLVFLRGEIGGERQSTRVMRLDLATGEVAPYFLVSPDELLTVYSPMYLEPGGSLLIAVQPVDQASAQQGIWRIGPGGSRIDLVLAGSESTDFPLPQMTDISADGSYVALVSMGALMRIDVAQSPYALLDLTTGEVLPVPDPDADMTATDIFGWMTFAGDTNDPLYLTHTAKADVLALTIGRTDPAVLPATVPLSHLGRGLDWAANDTVLLPGPHGAAVLVTLEAGGVAT